MSCRGNLRETSAGWTLHQLRHTRRSDISPRTVGLAVLMAKSRHISLGSLQRYADPVRRRSPR